MRKSGSDRQFTRVFHNHPRMDLTFWYDVGFGSPLARVQGLGYIQELVARLTHTPIATHNSSTNATLNDNPITFPLNQSLYVDATHEVVVLYGAWKRGTRLLNKLLNKACHSDYGSELE